MDTFDQPALPDQEICHLEEASSSKSSTRPSFLLSSLSITILSGLSTPSFLLSPTFYGKTEVKIFGGNLFKLCLRMRTAVLLSTLLAHGVHGKSRSGGVAASCHRSRQTSIAWTKFSASNVACSPRGGQHGYGIYDGKDDIYDTTRGKPSPYLPYDEDRYSDPSNPRRRASRDYYNDYYGRPGDDERYIDEDRGYYDDRGLPSVST